MTDWTKLSDSNTAAKILAFIMAFVLWLYVLNEQNPPLNMTYSVELGVQNAADSLVVTEAPRNIKVKIRGPRTVISNFTAENIKAFIDLQDTGKGEYDRQVHVSVPGEVQFVEAAPDTVKVSVDNFLQRTLPADIKNTGRLPDDLQVVSMLPSPRYASVSGAESIVNKVARLEALFNSEQKTKGEIRADVPLAALDEAGNKVEGLLIEPNNVTITANFEEKIIGVSLPVRVVLTGSLPEGFKLAGAAAAPERVGLRGTSALLAGVTEVYTEEISLDGLRRNSIRRVRLRAPQGAAASPDIVEVELQVEKD